ncbi:sushi, von Willebrand factor type A, EGF and pentraxin domain-containing protein 1 [Caerostris extrusa]|uniref:Sushi, von Willebrand factor type A, EGF and pentraxin domain-containing protein 1 n=1 Tax=Caerostris extrusa TaxID=172846 RepID=A0AAV4Y7R0_CAEEX|nr:sushi, von Willebrand factor type A, EGF and pentraxin domain-containing protein 1 [Caerostris extrusa]
MFFNVLSDTKFAGTVLFFKSDCSGRDIGYECHLVCKNGGRIIGSGYIKCLPNYTWTSLPDCTCPVPHVTNNLEFKEDCSKRKLYLSTACSRKDLKAKFGDCMSKKRGEKCFIECKDKDSKLIGDDFLLCRRNAKWGASQKGEWYDLPVCSESYCHPPNVAGTVVDLKENCSRKRMGDECQLLCKHGGSIIGNDRIKCLFNNSWSTLPDCTCSSPHIKGDLELKEECSLKQRGGRCAVGCRGNDTIHYITCQNNTMWSKMPKCGKFTWTCDVPELPVPLLSFEESWKECEFKDYGDICNLVCLGGSQMVGSGTLICQRNGEWTAIPDCTCGTPILPFDFETKENCTYKKAGENCAIGCKDAVSVSSRDYITCVETRRWDFMNHVLECVKSFCTLPVIPQEILKFEENCMKRKVGGTCRLSCRAGGSMLYSVDYITCFPNDTWSTLPECTCPDPYVTEDLDILENCKKKPNEVCAISCKNEYEKAVTRYITCQNNTLWSSLPRCSKKFCPTPTSGWILGYVKNRKYCTHKMAGEICQVYCIGGGNIIGKNILTCQENGEWSPFPDCTCPTPVLTKDLEFREDCSHKRFNERCLLKCKHGLSMDKQYILCDNFRRWESLPVCEKPSCPLPILPDKNIVTYKDDCSVKKPGDACHMICIQGGYAHLDASRIVCRQNLTWSKFKYPICSCSVPILTEALVFKEDCTSKWPSQFCLLGCKMELLPVKNTSYAKTIANGIHYLHVMDLQLLVPIQFYKKVF